MSDHDLEHNQLESLRRKVAEMRTRQAALAARQELLENLIALARSGLDASIARGSGQVPAARRACAEVAALL
jgi:hypothetical protein